MYLMQIRSDVPKKIQVSNTLYNRLAAYASGFDTPAAVIEKILDNFEGKKTESSTETGNLGSGGKDYTRYRFNGVIHPKSRLAWALVNRYVEEHPGIAFDTLLEAFPAELQNHGLRVFVQKEEAQALYERTGYKRYRIGTDEVIEIEDCMIAVCSQWGTSNIHLLLGKADELGYKVDAV